MSVLTEALDRIFDWKLQQNQFYLANLQKGDSLDRLDEKNKILKLNPGLSSQEIETITKDLPFPLPPEIHELYRWRNGTSTDEFKYEVNLFFDVGRGWGSCYGFDFRPLQVIVERFMMQRKINGYILQELEKWGIIPDTMNWHLGLNIFFSYECRDGFVVFDEKDSANLVIFMDYKGGSSDVIAKYSSLTNMMLTIADCYDRAFYRDSNGYLCCDEKKAKEIWQQYNSPQIVQRTLDRFAKVEDLLPKMDMNTGFDFLFLEEVGDALRFSHDPKLIELLIRVMTKSITYDENSDYLRAIASMFIPSGSADAVKPLIVALKHECWLTRYWAACTLGYLNDTRAIDPLIKILRDNNSQVREMAREALDRLIVKYPEISDRIPF
jgi:hypothetical protein